MAQSEWQARWQALMRAPRVLILAFLILGIFGLFGRRLWFLQFVEGEQYAYLAETQSTSLVTIPTSRGIIYARDGTPLVHNVPSFRVTIVPYYLPEDEHEMNVVLIRLAMLLEVPYTTTDSQEAEGRYGLSEQVNAAFARAAYYQPIQVARNVDRTTALMIIQEGLTMPGVFVEVDSTREYTYGSLVSQVLGFMQPIPEGMEEEYIALGYDPSVDRIGVQGIEAMFEDTLHGQTGSQIVEVDVMGRTIREIERYADPVPGGNVYLTLDLDLQQFVDDALQRGLARINSPRGVAIVMNPQTGEVLAMSSQPTYDNNMFSRGITQSELEHITENEHRPMLNHAISDGLPPGSVFKTVMAIAALQENVIDEDTRLTCPGTISLPDRYFPNDPGRYHTFYCWIWRQGSHGALNVVNALAQSCDIFFYKVGGGFEEEEFEGLGPERIANYSRLFGLGTPTGIELTAEISGTVPTPTWKRLTYGENWSTGDTYNLSIGQGFLVVSPLQMLNAVNVVANSGTLYRPQIVHHITDALGNETESFQPEVIRTLDMITPTYWSLVQQGMELAVSDGTATLAQVDGVRVAGKTGTAQFCDDIMCGTGGYDMPEHAWFTAFAPVEDPQISVIVFLYNGGEGSQNAAPVAQEILEYYFTRDESTDETP